jgi:hypothetical protein
MSKFVVPRPVAPRSLAPRSLAPRSLAPRREPNEERLAVEFLVPGDVVVDDAGERHKVARVDAADRHTRLTLANGTTVRLPARLQVRIDGSGRGPDTKRAVHILQLLLNSPRGFA